jgi:hypothetical protein
VSIIGRVFLKDFRRFWPLALTAALLAFFLAFFPMLGISGANGSMISAAGSVRSLVIGLLVVAVVQEDPVLSDRAAWITRPMTGSGVLAAKLLLLLVLLVVPFGVITAFGAHRYDLGMGKAALVGWEHTSHLLAGTIFLMALGAFTSSLLAAVVAFAGIFVVAVVFQPYLALFGTDTSSLDSYSVSACMLLALALTAVLGHFYSRRQLRWSLPTGMLVLVLALPVSNWLWAGTPEKGPIAGVKVTATSSRGFVGSTVARPFPFSDLVVVGMEVTSAVPADMDYYVGAGRGEFLSPSRGGIMSEVAGSIQTDDNTVHGIYSIWNYYPRTAQIELGLALKNREPDSVIAVMAVPSQTFDRFRGSSGSLRVQLVGNKRFVSERGELRCEPGAIAFVQGQRLQIEAVRTISDGLEMNVRTLSIISSAYPVSTLMLALINDRTGEVSLQEYGHDFTGSAQSYLISDQPTPVAFVHRWNRLTGKIEGGLSPAWLASSRLAYFALAVAPLKGSAELTVPNFTMPTIGGSQ